MSSLRLQNSSVAGKRLKASATQSSRGHGISCLSPLGPQPKSPLRLMIPSFLHRREEQGHSSVQRPWVLTQHHAKRRRKMWTWPLILFSQAGSLLFYPQASDRGGMTWQWWDGGVAKDPEEETGSPGDHEPRATSPVGHLGVSMLSVQENPMGCCILQGPSQDQEQPEGPEGWLQLVAPGTEFPPRPPPSRSPSQPLTRRIPGTAGAGGFCHAARA